MIANLELYRAFHQTAKEQNISRAAEKLFLTQPSVSHAIKQLEQELGVTLFHRSPKGVRLTEEGSILFAQVEQAFNFIESAERQIGEIKLLLRGELRLGSSDSLCKHYLLPPLGLFSSRHPQIRLDLLHGTTPEIVRLVKEGRIDFGIVRLPVDDPSISVLETISVQDCFVAGPRFFSAAEQPMSLAELVSHPLILFSRNSSSRRFIEQFGLAHGIAIESEIELASVDLLIEFAKAGLGISFVTREFVQTELEQGKLREIQLKEPIPPRSIGVAFLRSRPLAPATQVFLEQYLNVQLSEGRSAGL